MRITIRVPVEHGGRTREVETYIRKKGFPMNISFTTDPTTQVQRIQFNLDVLDENEAISMLEYMRSHHYEYLFPIALTQTKMSFWIYK